MKFVLQSSEGQELTHELFEVLREAFLQPFTTRSDFARAHAEAIGVAAENAYLTLYVDAATVSNVWRLTLQGVNMMHILHEQLRRENEDFKWIH